MSLAHILAWNTLLSDVDPRHHSLIGEISTHLGSSVARGQRHCRHWSHSNCCHFFQPLHCLKWRVNNSFKFFREQCHSVYQLAAVPLSLELERRVSHSKAWVNIVQGDHCTSFPPLKDIQISAAVFKAWIRWKLLESMTKTSVCPAWTIPSVDVCSACNRWIRTRVSAST